MINTTNKSWSKEEELIFKEKCESSLYTFEEIGKMIGRTPSSCYSKASKMGLSNKHKGQLQYTVDENFWAINPISAYWAGFSASDCFILERGPNSHFFSISIATKDKNHLIKFKEITKFSGEIKEYVNAAGHGYCKLSVSSCKWYRDLGENYNITPVKENRQPPIYLNDYLKWCYIIGYICGDGHLSYSESNKRLAIGIISCSYDVIKWISETVDPIFDKYTLRKREHSSFSIRDGSPHFSITGTRAAVLVDFLNRFPVPSLDRKWRNPKVLQYVDKIKKLKPQFFLDNDSLYNSLQNQYNSL